MSIGIRVVRGPDWNYGDKDGGEGHVGSVTSVQPDSTCNVVWDNGRETVCNIGKDGRYDLRIVDNAPAGVKHMGIVCDECQQNNVRGVRWKCCECHDYDLCTICYFADKHSLTHQFLRFNTDSSVPIKVSKRSTSQRMRALGIFPGAIVVRGKDWSYGTQDGGSGSEGKVIDMRNYGGDSGARNAVKVKWKNGEINVYKLGAAGKVDLKFIEPGVGSDYYRDHLDVFDLSVKPNRMSREVTESSTVEDEDDDDEDTSSVDSSLHVGDKVVVFLPADDLKQVQRGRGGWSMRMTECIGQIGKVKSIESDDTVEVEYDGNSWQFYKGAVRKVYAVKPGDRVKILSDPKMVELLQKGHGGWEDSMAKACGKVGKIDKIDSDGDVVVQFGQQVWVYSPACMIPAPNQTVDSLDGQQTHVVPKSTSSGENVQEELADGLARLIANVMVLGHLEKLRSVGPQQMIQACAQGDISTVQQLLKLNKDLVNCTVKDLTPLMLASHGGYLELVKLLLTNGANVNAKSDDQLTAIFAATAKKHEDVALFLLSNGASAYDVDKNGRSLVHHASYNGMFALLKTACEKGCDPNKQDVEGDTALHDAIAKGHDRAVNILLSHPNINLKLCNKKDFNPLMFAALKENEFAIEKLLDKMPALMKMTKTDGKSPLHIAAINDHRQVASILILKGKANPNFQDSSGLIPLHLACHEAYPEMVKLLVQHGSDVNMKDSDGDTPLHITLGIQKRNQLPGILGLMLAAPNDDTDRAKIAFFLLDNKANIKITNNNGRTPLQICRSQRVKEAVERFIREKHPEQSTPTRSASNDPLLNLLSALVGPPCAACKQKVADATFIPCRHKIVCENCSVRFDVCPQCNMPIQARIDNQGRRIVLEDPCQVQ